MPLQLSGDVSRVAFDHSVHLLLEDGAELRISTPLRLSLPGAAELELDPETSGLGLGRLLALLHATVTEATVGSDGALRLAFDVGAALVVAPDGSYESWQISWPDGRLVVCVP